MTLAHKALLLLILPLVFDLTLVITLSWLSAHADEQAADLTRSRLVAAQTSAIVRNVFEEVGLFTNAVVQSDPRLKSWQENLLKLKNQKLNQELEKFERLVQGSSLQDSYSGCIATIRTITSSFEEKSSGDNLLAAVKLVRRFQPQINALTTQVDKVNEKEAARIELLSKNESRLRRIIQTIGTFGCLANISLSVALSLYFNKSTVNRLKILMRKLVLWSRNESTNLPASQRLEGSDEIAQLDRAFEEMVTLRGEMESELREREKRYSMVVNTIPVGLVTLDEVNKIDSSNVAMQTLTGYSATEMFGLSLSDLLKDVATLKKINIDNLIVNRGSGRRLECFLQSKLDQALPVEVICQEIVLAGRQRPLVVISDISERYELDEFKKDFFNMISHDIRSPLTSLQASLDQLRRGAGGQLNEQGSSLVNRADRNLGMALSLITDFLDLERIESSGFKLSLRDVEAKSLLLRAVDIVDDLAQRQRIQIDVICPQVSLKVDADRIIQVLVNLLSNALKFSQHDTVIRVVVQEQVSSLLFSVIDQGRGIAIDKIDTVFLKFQQSHRSDAAHGTGLGLAICKALVTAHDGEIGAINNDGGGSTIWFTLPKTGPQSKQTLEN
jgi:PAS domain S-box-containing protein